MYNLVLKKEKQIMKIFESWKSTRAKKNYIYIHIEKRERAGREQVILFFSIS